MSFFLACTSLHFSICDEYFMWKGFNSLNVWAHSFSNVQGKTTTKILLHFYFLLTPRYIKTCFRQVCLLWSAVCLLLPGSLHILVTWFWSTLVTNFAFFMFMFFSQLSCAVLKFSSLRTNLTDEIAIRNSLLLKILPQ